MIINKHIKEIKKILNKEKIINHKLLQISFGIACIKLELSEGKKYIAKFSVDTKQQFNAIKSETKTLLYLNKRFKFFPKMIISNDNYLIIEYFENDNDKPKKTNLDLLESIIAIHSVSNNFFGFKFNTQIGASEQINNFDNSWVNFYSSKRLNPIFELSNKKIYLGNFINEKINYILKNMKNFIPDKPPALLLHGDLWEGNILFNKNKFVGFIDPGSFFGHNEMEVAYLRWFKPSFIDSNFLEKYNDYIALEKNYLDYETIYQIYYSLCNVALWDNSYINETKRLLVKLKI
jgi:protein-ribulosamine 3-kinase